MKANRARIGIVIAWIVGLIAICTLLFAYVSTVSEKSYDDAKRNFSEVYQQVETNFLTFMNDAWKNLHDWGPYIRTLDDAATADYIEDRRSVWGFSRFLFINEQGEAISLQGERMTLPLDDELADLFEGEQQIMTESGLDTATPETIFASSIQPSTYMGFAYEAVAMTYTNADLANTLKTEAFSGESIGFIVYPDGTIALSTQQGGNVFSNYLTYLAAGSDLSDEQIESLEQDWVSGETGVLVCKMNDEEYYISYRPLGYEDYVLLGVVPTDAVSGSLRNVQEMTVDVFVKIFLIILVLIVIQMIIWLRQRTKRSQIEIEYRDALFDLLSENLDDIFVVIDADTLDISYLTPNVDRLLGVSTETARSDVRLLQKSLADHDEAVDFEDLRNIELGKRHEVVKEWINQKDGSRRWFKEAIYRLRIQDSEKFIFILSDRTEERAMSQSLEEALATAKHANKAKSDFLSNMSHDIRTPMNAIMGFTSLLETHADNPERVREYVRKINASSRHLLSLINDVLDMSKIESGKTELAIADFSFADLLEEINTIMAPQAAAKDQSFEIRMEGHPSEHLMGDKLRINQILINLLSNAVKYTQVGGSIEFIIKQLPSASPNYDNVRFIVKDNGMGMSEEYLRVIFDPFTRETNSVTNAIQGTGLGMAITKSIVDLMGGTIKVESEPGAGSTFSVELSLATSDLHERDHFWQTHPDFRIYVIDDEDYICEDIKSTLGLVGIHVDYANNGAAGIEAIQAAHDEGNPYDLILIDWQMPWMSGVDVARKLRSFIDPSVLIIVLTAYDWSEIEDEAVAGGVNDFLPKPFFATSLSHKLTALSHESEVPSEDEVDADVLRGLNILAAEDNEMSAEMLIERLDMEGATVTRARDGSEAVKLFEASTPGQYDLILMDVEMPIMGGHEATRTIRASDHPEAKTIPIFAMTANVFADDVRSALDAGMDVHIPKPIDMDELRRAADKMLNRKEGSNDQAH